MNPNFTVSSVEYLGPEEELPPPGRTIPHITQSQLINGHYRSAKATDEGKIGFLKWLGVSVLSFIVDQYESVQYKIAVKPI